jgi:beta-galactosidase GanA
MKAAGLNTVSIYLHWGIVEQKRGSVDWNYWRSLELFYQIAQRVGIYVIARPGVGLVHQFLQYLKLNFY